MEKQDYYINLVFYNCILKSSVLIDLKTEKIIHQNSVTITRNQTVWLPFLDFYFSFHYDFYIKYLISEEISYARSKEIGNLLKKGVLEQG